MGRATAFWRMRLRVYSVVYSVAEFARIPQFTEGQLFVAWRRSTRHKKRRPTVEVAAGSETRLQRGPLIPCDPLPLIPYPLIVSRSTIAVSSNAPRWNTARHVWLAPNATISAWRCAPSFDSNGIATGLASVGSKPNGASSDKPSDPTSPTPSTISHYRQLRKA